VCLRTGQPGLGPQRFLPWATWVCLWTALFLVALALGGACRYIDRCAAPLGPAPLLHLSAHAKCNTFPGMHGACDCGSRLAALPGRPPLCMQHESKGAGRCAHAASLSTAGRRPPRLWPGARRFTRFSGELFGGLIALLFLQQAVRGAVSEFRRAPAGAAWPGAACVHAPAPSLGQPGVLVVWASMGCMRRAGTSVRAAALSRTLRY